MELIIVYPRENSIKSELQNVQTLTYHCTLFKCDLESELIHINKLKLSQSQKDKIYTIVKILATNQDRFTVLYNKGFVFEDDSQFIFYYMNDKTNNSNRLGLINLDKLIDGDPM